MRCGSEFGREEESQGDKGSECSVKNERPRC